MIKHETFKTHMSGEEVEVTVQEAVTKVYFVKCPRCKKVYTTTCQVFRGEVPDDELETVATERNRVAFEALKEAVEECDHVLNHLKENDNEEEGS